MVTTARTFRTNDLNVTARLSVYVCCVVGWLAGVRRVVFIEEGREPVFIRLYVRWNERASNAAATTKTC